MRIIQRPVTVSTREPSSTQPRVIPGGRTTASEPSPFKTFARPGVWTLAASVGLVVFTGVVTFVVMRSKASGPPPDAAVFRDLGARPLDAPSRDVAGTDPIPARALVSAPATSLSPAAREALEAVERIEAGHAAGTWSVLHKRIGVCAGEDAERVAWVDGSSRVVKVTDTRGAGDDVARTEQWFDADGRLRGVRAAGAHDAWSVRALLDESGAVAHREVTGAAPPLESLRLSKTDPSRAFFATPRCDPEKQSPAP